MILFSKCALICKKILLIISNLLWTHTCPICSEEIKITSEKFCIKCKKDSLEVQHNSGCIFCGKKTATTKCIACSVERPYITMVGSVLIYNNKTKKLITHLKGFRDLRFVKKYAEWMSNQNTELFNDIDLIVPVPITRIRLLIRKFNQSALLANQISKIRGIDVNVIILKRRIAFRRKQSKLSRTQREMYFSKIFYINDKEKIANKRILLIDDVLTTGATANACAQVLIENGAKEVRLLTLMRTYSKSQNS